MSTITREQAQAVSDLKAGYTLGHADAAILKELARIALASLEAEPVAWIWRWSDDEEGVWRYSEERKETKGSVTAKPLYTAPPAPTVTFYRDGIEAAAAWVDQQRESYDNEHGRHDPDTGMFEFGNDAQRDYSATLEEIAEGIRGLHPNTAPPAPVAMKDHQIRELVNDLRDIAVKYHGTQQLRERIARTIRAAMLQCSQPVSNRDELREQVRREHAEWSDATFGNVGPVGPLKHLSKEALEAAAEPDDLSEWADMQFLLWDAQRRAGISDGEITAAMEEKLKVNMRREWPEPKDGEPRLHIKSESKDMG